MNGFLLVNKPKEMTSYDIIRKIKPLLEKKTKIGHSGTLDPFAEGLMIIAIGRTYTKQLNQWLNLDKSYHAEITFGVETDSYDCTGNVTQTHPKPIALTEPEIHEIIKKFTGHIAQTPPIYSAKKINGKRAYTYARTNTPIELNPSNITIYKIKLLTIEKNKINVTIHCSKGTYIRSLAHDMGQELSIGAHLSQLTRTSIGNVSVDTAISIDVLSKENLHHYLIEDLIP